jgi:predicted DNA-binding protein
MLKGDLGSRTATKLVREWIDLHISEIEEDWQLAKNSQELKKIEPLK